MLFPTITRPLVYKKFGDVNPIEHGGGFYTETSKGEFDIIHIQPDEEHEGFGWWNVVSVDTTDDSWIDVKSICSFADIGPDNVATIDFALACIDYYGIENFGGNHARESAISHREIEKLYNTIESENFIEDDENSKHRIVNYFDVWGNSKDGYEVNNMCEEGVITLHMNATNEDVLKALKKFGFLKKHVRMNMIQFEGAYMDIWEINDSKGKPICRVEPIIEEPDYKHTITYDNEHGKRIQKHFETKSEVYKFLDTLPNDLNDVWTAYGYKEEEPAKEMEKNNIKIEGHRGTWYVIDEKEHNGEKLYLLEHETYGDTAACLIVRQDLSIFLDDVWNGFDDLNDLE